MTAELITPRDTSLEALQEYIADCASVVRDKDPKSPAKLWDRLLTESFGNTASRVFEYIPCTISNKDSGLHSQYFGFFTDIADPDATYCTTMRELLNWGWTVEQCLEVVDFSDYRTFKCMAPYFIYGQLSTHNQITSVSHSQRYGVCDRGYWMPPELDTPEGYGLSQSNWNHMVETLSPIKLKGYMKDYYVRKEVWDRGADLLQNRVFLPRRVYFKL